MWTVHQRIAELWYKLHHQGGLTEEETSELKLCLDAHMRKAQKLADLENQSLMASISNDTDWQHEICKKIDKLKEELYGV